MEQCAREQHVVGVVGTGAIWMGAIQTADDSPEPAQRLTRLKLQRHQGHQGSSKS